MNIGLSLEEMLLAVNLAIEYQIDLKDFVILDLVLNNYAPPNAKHATEQQRSQHEKVKKYIEDKIKSKVIEN